MDNDIDMLSLSLPDGSVIRVHGEIADISLFVSMLKEDYRSADLAEMGWQNYIQAVPAQCDWKLTATAEEGISDDTSLMVDKITQGYSHQYQLNIV